MNSYTEYAVWLVRVLAGLLLVIIGVQPSQPIMTSNNLTIYLVTLHLTHAYMLDVGLRFLFVGLGLAIMRGIRTRFLAAFMLVMTIFQPNLILQHNPTFSIENSPLMLLILALSVLVVREAGEIYLSNRLKLSTTCTHHLVASCR